MVLIDMEMPGRCLDCRFSGHDFFGHTFVCNAMEEQPDMINYKSKTRPEWCPLFDASDWKDKPLDGMFSESLDALDRMMKTVNNS